MLIVEFLHKFHIREKSCLWDTGQNALSQSCCRILKSTISPEQMDKTAAFFACWCNFKYWKLFEKFLVGHGQNMGVANPVSGL